MDTVREIVEFTSEAFRPTLPEESQVNPGRYGAELAFWLCTELARRGVVTSYPNSEDWGWFIEYFPGTSAEFAVLCGNVDGSADRWLLCLKRHPRKMFGRDKPPFSEAASLVAAVREAVQSVAPASAIDWRWDTADAV